MTKRKCVYTGQDSNEKDSVIPRHLIKDEHNWSVHVPTTTDYKQQKINRYPTELEIQAAETFYMLEISRLKVEFYENKLAQIQEEINKNYTYNRIEKPKNEGKKAEKRKSKEIQIAEKQKEIQILEKDLDKILQDKIEQGYEAVKENLWED